MTNVKETPITTLKAEVVNDIVILKKGHSNGLRPFLPNRF